MRVNVEDVKRQYMIIKDEHDKYIDTNKKYVNNLKDLNMFWNSKVALDFYNDCALVDKGIKNLIDNIEKTVKLYEYIISNYSKIGNEIVYLPELKNNLKRIIKSYGDTLSRLLTLYDSVNTSEMLSNEIGIIRRQRSVYKRDLDKLNLLKRKYLNMINNIDNIELSIHSKINNIDIDTINVIEREL